MAKWTDSKTYSQMGYHAFGLDSPDDQKEEEEKAAQSAPSVEAPKAMPVPAPDDQSAQAARRRSIIRQQQRRGRESTILTALGSDDPLGG